MTIQLQPPDKVVSRKRKAHTKSRRGCGNCKLRRVKCDETKPRCKRCIAYTVSCSYDPESLSELQPSVAGAFSIEIPRKLPCSLEQTILGTLNTSASNPAYLLDSLDLKLLSKFQARTVLTIGTPKTSLICQSEMPKIALAHPFLLHIILTLTLLHDRHLSLSRTARYSVAESFHWYRGTALLNAKLSAPLLPSERQAVWATAGLLGAIAFSAINAKLPEEAWPLAPPSSNDLHWLRMSDGKKQFAMRATNADSFIVQAMATEFENDFRPTSSLKESELDDLPFDFITLYGLNPTSSSDNNPYFAAISILVRLLPMTCTHATVIKFMSFTTHMQPELKTLLSQKDPRALLLLAYWYAEICQYPQWWCRPRSTLECQAICIYLERYHGDDPNIQKLLPHPRMMCGLLPT